MHIRLGRAYTSVAGRNRGTPLSPLDGFSAALTTGAATASPPSGHDQIRDIPASVGINYGAAGRSASIAGRLDTSHESWKDRKVGKIRCGVCPNHCRGPRSERLFANSGTGHLEASNLLLIRAGLFLGQKTLATHPTMHQQLAPMPRPPSALPLPAPLSLPCHSLVHLHKKSRKPCAALHAPRNLAPLVRLGSDFGSILAGADDGFAVPRKLSLGGHRSV